MSPPLPLVPSSLSPRLLECPDVVVATPSRCLAHINAGNLTLSSGLEMLVVDEADLVLSYGSEDDVKKILSHTPSAMSGTCQSLLLSATLTTDLHSLGSLMLNDPVMVEPVESLTHTSDRLKQWYTLCATENKLMYVPGVSLFCVSLFALNLRTN
jgi:ATP-dependent RNA helicase DDX56/DBP9